ncbi:hypothetical protein [Burkholderia glumae]|uniref:hypothetical protein n=1 Tax=Burkholderia glumae TaxID=337 RepID=UPI0018DEDAB2|nr:hypothetical protein [Burkholderia glumae]
MPISSKTTIPNAALKRTPIFKSEIFMVHFLVKNTFFNSAFLSSGTEPATTRLRLYQSSMANSARCAIRVSWRGYRIGRPKNCRPRALSLRHVYGMGLKPLNFFSTNQTLRPHRLFGSAVQ